jgi:GntR family transcriptional regulator
MSFAQLIGELPKDDPAPLYLQLKRQMRDAILGHFLVKNDLIPPERDLAKALNISRITVRKAIDGLVMDGFLIRRRGARTFVTLPVEKSLPKLSSFSEEMISQGRKPHSRWLDRSKGLVTAEEALALGLPPGAVVYRFARARFADGVGMALEYSVIPGYCLPAADAVGTSLYEALGQYGNRPVRALQRIRAISFTAEQAELIDVKPGDAGLFVERRSFLRDGRSAEYTRCYYHGDAYDVVAELTHTDGTSPA